MRLAWIALEAFRSYPSLEWHPEPGVNLLVGANGAGKTNLLEAVGYLSSLKSFRAAPDDALIEFDRDAAVIRGEVTERDASSLIELEIPKRGSRRVLVNRSRLPRVSEMLGHVRVIGFLPDDLDIVKRGPAHRRDFLDDLAVQLWPAGHADQAEFGRALRQRNAFLRHGEDDPVTLGVWDERLAQAGGRVMARRARAADALAGPLQDSYRRIAGQEAALGFSYVSSWGGALDPRVPASEHAGALADSLVAARRMDRERRMTTVGPHRDEPLLLLGGHDLRFHGSQGEQRTAALSLRVGSHRAVTDLTGTVPVLLLDDVFSELDPERSAALTSALPGAQTLVTTAHAGTVPLEGRIWQVAEGKVT